MDGAFAIGDESIQIKVSPQANVSGGARSTRIVGSLAPSRSTLNTCHLDDNPISSTSSICSTQMSVSSRDSEPHSGAADHQDSSSLTSKRQYRSPRNLPDGARYIRCPPRNNERANNLLRKYADDGVSDRKKISELLAKEHGIHMSEATPSEATVARRRRTLGLAKRPGAPTKISDVKKRLYIWKHRDVCYKGLKRSKGIQRALEEDYDIHITEAYISQALKGVNDGKTGPHGGWRITIYQPFPGFGLYILIIRDAWTGCWSYMSTISCDYKDLSIWISSKYFGGTGGAIPKQVTIQYDNNELQEFEPVNIEREYLSEKISRSGHR
ncbi:hypothetical protein M422DRAFT_239774 [Sphaerobolus stellatus SS14]|nr:hypothetical protein M422DRAFT_239774 [Sphaerobolus stellatus SS14]